MALTAKKALAIANQYTDDTVVGGGAIKGKNCTIDSIEPISGGQRVTFKWTLDDGTTQTTTMDVMDGVDGQDGQDGQDGKGIKSVAVNEESHLIITYTDDTTYDAGAIEVHSAVDSVNGKTGEVTLTASDVGALPSDTEIPSKTSDLTNDSNFVADASYVHTDNNYDATAKDIVDNVTTALAGKVDKETGKSLIDLTTVVDGASYDSTNHLILFKNGTTTLFSLDAAAFVKDGMVDTVSITGGNLVITFNTDAGKQAISIPITDIFDPANYYDKTATDNLLADKADKVASATNGNFAGLDANGNLTDSGKKASDFGTADEIADIVNVYGAKNLMETKASSHTQNGITKTVNADGSFTLNGTATDNTYLYWMGQTEFPTENIQYTYSIETSAVWGIGNIIAGIDKRNETQYIDRYKSIFADGTTHMEGTFTGESGYYAWAWIFIPNGTQLTDVIVKGMIRLASIKDDTFVPYAKTNHELTVDKAEQAEVNDIVNVLGAKNLNSYPYQDTTRTTNGITFTDNGDGTIKANGTATADAYFSCHSRAQGESNDLIIPNGAYRLSGCPSGGGTSTYCVMAQRTYNGEVNLLGRDSGNGTLFTANGDDFSANEVNIQINIFIKSGQTVSNLIFKPMIRLATDPDDTYQPYAMTNKELTEFTINKIGRQLPLVNLGTEYTAELKADISSGKFEKAVVGGYLTINGHVYYLAHPDYWLHTGDTECTTHHMLVIPADNIGTGKMNSSNITTGGYAGSDIKTGNNSNTALAAARAQIIADFGAANVLMHRELFTTAVTDGKASNWVWADSDVDLMNEVMVYGCNVWGSHPGYETGIDKCQLKLFQERPDLITTRSGWWLRGVVSAALFARVSDGGNADPYGASYALGVRPAFAIC